MLDLHENRIEEAKQHAKKALEISKTYESTNHRYLLSKLKYVQSALARRGDNYAEAKELLDDSVEVRTNRIRIIANNCYIFSIVFSFHKVFLQSFLPRDKGAIFLKIPWCCCRRWFGIS